MVVQLALDTISMFGLYVFSLTPTTNIGASAEGAEITTFFAPPCTWDVKNTHIEVLKSKEVWGEGRGRCVWVCNREREKLSTFLCSEAFSIVVKTPEDSTTKSAPYSPHGISEGFLEDSSSAFKFYNENE